MIEYCFNISASVSVSVSVSLRGEYEDLFN